MAATSPMLALTPTVMTLETITSAAFMTGTPVSYHHVSNRDGSRYDGLSIAGQAHASQQKQPAHVREWDGPAVLPPCQRACLWGNPAEGAPCYAAQL